MKDTDYKHGFISDSRQGYSPLCSDRLAVYLKIGADKETVEDISFEGEGGQPNQNRTVMQPKSADQHPPLGYGSTKHPAMRCGSGASNGL